MDVKISHLFDAVRGNKGDKKAFMSSTRRSRIVHRLTQWSKSNNLMAVLMKD
jgi:hypothetical protein